MGVTVSLAASLLLPFYIAAPIIIVYWVWQLVDAYQQYKKLNQRSVSSLYDSTSIDVVASPLGSSPPQPSTATESNDNKITSSTVKPQTSLLMAVPPNADIWARIQITPDESTENYYYIPPTSIFNFKAGGRLCPVSPCEQEFFDGVLRKVSSAPNQYFFSGILKIIDKSVASNPDIKNWLYYPFDGEFLIKGTKENVKAGSTVENFVGDLGLDRDKLIKYVIALDALLAQGRPDKSETVAKRYTAIMCQYWKDNDLIQRYCTIKTYYSIRNQIVHGGLRYIDENILKQLRLWVSELVYNLLSYCSDHNVITDLFKNLFPVNEDLLKNVKCEDNLLIV